MASRTRSGRRSPLPTRRGCAGGVITVAASLLVPGTASAQIELQIVDGSGLAVPAARVEVYGRAELLHVLSTDADGVATVPADRWDDARRLSITHLGFEALIVQSEGLRTGMRLQLTPEALTLEGLQVQVQGELCPLQESEAARALWQEVAARYSTDTGRRRLTASYLYGAGSVSETSLRYVSESGLGRSSGSRVPRTTATQVGLLESVVERHGYSWEPPQRRWGRRDLNRSYPSLEMWHAYHFATPTFGTRHSFSVLRDRSGSTVLAFCPKPDAHGTALMGTLELIPGERFVQRDLAVPRGRSGRERRWRGGLRRPPSRHQAPPSPPRPPGDLLPTQREATALPQPA